MNCAEVMRKLPRRRKERLTPPSASQKKREQRQERLDVSWTKPMTGMKERRLNQPQR
jgi:hypothetical protein